MSNDSSIASSSSAPTASTIERRRLHAAAPGRAVIGARDRVPPPDWRPAAPLPFCFAAACSSSARSCNRSFRRSSHGYRGGAPFGPRGMQNSTKKNGRQHHPLALDETQVAERREGVDERSAVDEAHHHVGTGEGRPGQDPELSEGSQDDDDDHQVLESRDALGVPVRLDHQRVEEHLVDVAGEGGRDRSSTGHPNCRSRDRSPRSCWRSPWLSESVPPWR